MRALLFPSYRGSGFGHIGRCLALAEALTRQGWDVAFFLGPPHADRVAKDGWTVFRPLVTPPPSRLRRLAKAVLGRLQPTFTYLFFSDLNFQAVRDGFHTSEAVRQEVAWELDVVNRFHPDVLVGDVWLLTSVVGRLAGLPVVQIVRSAAHPADPQLVWWREVPSQIHSPDVASVFNPALKQWGLSPIRRAEDLLDGDLILVPSIPALDPLPTGAERSHYVGPLIRSAASGQAEPEWMAALPDERPVVYVTVGGGSDAVRGLDLLSFWEDAFAGTDWEIVVSTGGKPVPRRQYRNMRVFSWLPGAAMVARADVVLFHGGYGTMMETVRAGVPSVVLPFHTEQEGNGRRLEQNEVAQVLAPVDDDLTPMETRWGGGQFTALTCRRWWLRPAQVRAAVSTVLEDQRYRTNAQRLCRAQAAYDGVALASKMIADLVFHSFHV